MTLKKLLLLSFLFTSFIHAQDADSLNLQSKELLYQKNFDKAFPLLQQAAEMGQPEAQYNLGYAYHRGMGTRIDLEAANKWYGKSAEQGYTDALYAMMMAYGNGDGLEQDLEKAFEYALRCADKGDSTCMWNVANCYKQGMGTEADLEKFLEWSVRLAQLPNPDDLQKSGYITSVRLTLAYMYRDGRDVEADPYRAYLWFLIYNEFKRDFSYLQQEQVVAEIQQLEEKLDVTQMESAPSDAEALLGRPLMNLEKLYEAEL
ncbi:tetratricopeptide repeat protein [Zeaxanthinibacter sp. PT1]|uniref:tetratricopeptide repeat protein n=1 Tax=Zeaxanthinibacter TaxID=561554 RepID=UPI00234AAB8F|nr:tetratricopeptide repeat protein [Zeaxanthinibacter sp. PT1]MDC6351048.1 tetratricopeptide repeat protein [Zeaxanthinibacter sp. PT1]